MAAIFEGNRVVFEGVVYEDDVIGVRDFLQQAAPSAVEFDFLACADIHLAVLQLLVAYKKNYECSMIFGSEKKVFQALLEGFDSSEDYCN